ncbi:MAG TPA: hypothetical protein VJ746_15280 [Nitrospira sp.]|nr:hypothetical protein [Nitrospira sp.]
MTIVTWLFVSSQSMAAPSGSDEGSRGKQWLGAYVGSSVPGYVVNSSFIVDYSATDTVKKAVTASVIRNMIAACQSGGGVALTNFRVSISTGRMPISSGLVDPGIFMQGIGDCVDKVEALKDAK